MIGWLALSEDYNKNPAKVNEFCAEADRVSRAFDTFFARNGYLSVLLCPPFPRRAPLHRAMYVAPYNLLYTAMWNALHMPACVVPMGLVGGLPVAIQLVGAQGTDALLVALALHIGNLSGGWRA